MCSPSRRSDALQAMTLVENVAMLSTLGVFGYIFSAFSDIGKAYLTFYCNAVRPIQLYINHHRMDSAFNTITGCRIGCRSGSFPVAFPSKTGPDVNTFGE